MQWPQDTKEVIRSRKSRKDRQYNGHKIPPLVSCGHCVVCPSSIYDLWLSFWYLVAIVLSFRPRFTTSDYPFGILWPLYCLSFLDLWLLITPLVSCGHCIVCHSSILYCLSFLDFVLYVIPRFRGRTDNTTPQDTKRVIRSRKSRKDRPYNGH
jgi:hypothetical protein